jgi:spore germination protein KA
MFMRYLQNKKNNLPANNTEEIISHPLETDIEANQAKLEALLEHCSDAVFREFVIGKQPPIRCLLLYFDGLVQRKMLDDNIIKSLLLDVQMTDNPKSEFEQGDLLTAVEQNIINVAELKRIATLQEVIRHISSGDTVLLIDGCSQALVAGTRGWESRSINTPENELVIYGPKEGFIENLRSNTALIRRRLKSSNFKIESMVIGKITQTDVVLCYIDNIAPPQLVDEVRKRLQMIDIDAVLDSNYIQELIMEHKSTIFSQAEQTEKPDRAAAHLLEGRICILVDGSPMALVLPVTFPRYWISPEDYYIHYIPASLFRIGRFLAFLVALTLPSVYVAVISYHQEMVPTALYLTIAASRQGIPFPSFVEALLLELTFEMLREAGLRLPRAVGPAVSIVGALIIGDAAVRAGLVSTPMVVVVAFTGIASFVTPSYNAGIIVRTARFAFLAAAALLGFLGIMIVFIIMLIRMASLSSFGMPYLSPIAPLNTRELTDVILRRPWFKMRERPYQEGMKNQVRQNIAGKE